MCSIDDADRAIVLHNVDRKARKPHRCSECARTIEPGEVYNHQATLFDGSKESYRCCAHCEVARDWLQAECGGWVYTEVADEVTEHFRDGYAQLGRLAASLRRRWRGFRGQLLPIPTRPPTSIELAHLEPTDA